MGSLDGKFGPFGYIDTNGKEVIPFKYDNAQNFEDGLAFVCLDWKHGFIDKNGNEIIPLNYDAFIESGSALEFIPRFCGGLLGMKLNGKFGYVDRQGKEVIPFKYDGINNFHKDGFAVVCLNGKYGVVAKAGNEVIPFKYDRIDHHRDGVFKFRVNRQIGFIDTQGNEVV